MESTEEMAAILRSFGDEKSTLLDKYERHSFEVQLNKAMLGRSLSEPAVDRYGSLSSQVVAKPVKQEKRSRGSGFQKVMKKLFSAILGKKGARKDCAKDAEELMLGKTCTRSLRA